MVNFSVVLFTVIILGLDYGSQINNQIQRLHCLFFVRDF